MEESIHQQANSRVKREDSSGSAGGSDPHGSGSGAAGGGATWDSDAESFHILSYFMGAGEGASAAASSHYNSGGLLVEDAGRKNRSLASTPSNNSSSSSLTNQNVVEPPPTPAVQFYSHHGGERHSPGVGSSRGAPPLTASSSSSSLSSMAAALVSGGPVVHSMYNTTSITSKKGDSPLSPSMMMHTSPLSPAGMIGPGQENLMLPPPPRFPKNNAMAGSTAKAGTESKLPPNLQEQQQQQQQPQVQQTTQHPAHDPEQKQRHLAWLQHLNSMAILAQQQQQQQNVPRGMPVVLPHGTAPLAPTPYLSSSSQAGVPAALPQTGETEERRLRRLKRNRESARESRRRKKEHLQKLAHQVNSLHTQIETERRKQIMEMEPNLARLRLESIECGQELQSVLKQTSPNCGVRKAVGSFQYLQLKQLLLPKHQEFLLWLSRQPEPYFTRGKEERAKVVADKQTTRATTGRVSSKQIGEDLTNEFKKKQPKKQTKKAGNGKEKRSASTSPTPSEQRNAASSPTSSTENKGYITAQAHDAAQVWPLLCYELSVSVDQEERLLQAHKKIHHLPTLENDCAQMAVATRMSASMRNGVLYQAHTANHRMQSGLLHILTEEQTVKYLQWFAANKARCLRLQQKPAQPPQQTSSSLSEICNKLERVLRIIPSSPNNDDDSQMGSDS